MVRTQSLGSSKHTNDSLSSLLHFSREAWQISYFLSFYKGRDQYQRATLVAQLIKNLPAMQETPVQFGLGRFPGEGNGYLLQYSGLENPMDCIVHGVAKSQTRLSEFCLSYPIPTSYFSSLYLCVFIWKFELIKCVHICKTQLTKGFLSLLFPLCLVILFLGEWRSGGAGRGGCSPFSSYHAFLQILSSWRLLGQG